ncbi:early nodulin-like protein 20 [Euphorbia lathyris]|uniref:early nodulin-like protein 20 n=1 Tax=Euphorbia lathyris TaxID=212925 RepID=UPI003313EF6E
MVLIIVLITSVDCRDPVLHKVGGGKYTWNESCNFTDWASHEHFYVGDWLYFGFNKTKYNVLEVNKTSYEKCNEKDFIANITRGGRDVFNLTEVKPYYFLSGFGYCLKGMKVSIFVQNAPPEFDHHLPQNTTTLPPLQINHASAPPPLFFPIFCSSIFTILTFFTSTCIS